ncbi:MAG: PAS domain S-box protein [Candidatus Eremiobacteraeota bacterium]|nr:PAS domain S-box protein [Candidatus Eremiobacteraeota bacterium]
MSDRTRLALGELAERGSAQEQIDILLSAIEAAGDAIVVYRVDAADQQLRITYVNEAFTRQTGYPKGEAIGKAPSDFRPPEHKAEAIEIVRLALATKEEVSFEIRNFRKDGSAFWNAVRLRPVKDPSGTANYWISVERDATDAVERERRLESENITLTQLASAARRLFSTLEPVELVNRLGQSVREAIHATTRLYSVTSGRRMVRTNSLSPEPGAPSGDALIQRATTADTYVTDRDLRRAAIAVRGSSGAATHVIEIETSLDHPIRKTDLFALYLIAQYFSVAARNVAVYHELDQSRQSVMELNQFKSDLITMLAHDFKSPLTMILGYAQLMLESDVDDEQREYLELISRSALQLANLATDTLTLSREEQNKIDLRLTEVDLVALLRELAGTFSDQAPVYVHTDLASVTIQGDLQRLRQIFTNLIDNAIKYSLKENPVDIHVRVLDDRVRVDVTDRGIGIPEDEVPKLFARFSRASNARELRISGTGFGLYLVKRFVERHGGNVDVRSEVGKGTTFSVTLPSSSTRSDVTRVLLFDTLKEDRSFLAHTLQAAEYAVTVVTEKETLFDRCLNERVDIVVLNDAQRLSTTEIARIDAVRAESGFSVVAIESDTARLPAEFRIVQKPYIMRDVLAALEPPQRASTPEVVPHRADR